MKQEMYDSMYRTERYHWWFHGKRELVLALAAPYLSALPAPHIIDFGCGCGAMLEALSPFGTVTGADFSPLALDYCRKRFPCELRQLDLSLPSVPNARFDFGVALDVLEHIENDLTAAKNIFSCLRPGGTCIITVPAYQWLWSAHDENCMHKRRYDRRTLQSLLLRSGFEITTMRSCFPRQRPSVCSPAVSIQIGKAPWKTAFGILPSTACYFVFSAWKKGFSAGEGPFPSACR